MQSKRRKYYKIKRDLSKINPGEVEPEGFGKIDWKQTTECVCGKSFYIKDGKCNKCGRERE